MTSAIPTPRQLEYQDWELGVFLHFGIRTFYEGHKDWDGKPMSPEAFMPTELDCNQWTVEAAKGGAKYMVLTAKHHDGFANWPSKYTDFSVASSPWRNGKGDVVREYTDACRKHGLKIGLYYSPADWTCPVYDDPKTYDDYFINQVSELLDGTYGEIDMLWFDGCGSEGHEYNWTRIIGCIREMQPNILIFNMGGDPDYRWVGNEAGVAPSPNWCSVDSVNFSIMTDEKEELSGEKMWLPAECDFMMRDRNWFFSDQDEDTVKSVEELLGNYYYSVGRGANMLVNIGPDRRGLLPAADVTSLQGMYEQVQQRFSTPIVTLDDFVREGNTWTYDSKNYEYRANDVVGTLRINHAVIAEELTNGESVGRFRISIKPYLHGKPIAVYEGTTIGHKAICEFSHIRCSGIIVEVLECEGTPELKSMQFFKV